MFGARKRKQVLWVAIRFEKAVKLSQQLYFLAPTFILPSKVKIYEKNKHLA